MYTDGIIFDMDGTIWDTCEVVAKTWQQAAENHDVHITFTADLMKSCMGLLMEDFGAKVMPDIEPGLRHEILTEGMDLENQYLAEHGGLLFPKVIETLEILSQKVPLFIVSNCQAGYIESFFQGHDTDKFFKDFENPGRTGMAKAENIRLICERNDLKAPVYVGDTQGDLDACKAAGVPFIYASYGFGSVDVGQCAKVIESFSELAGIFDE